jgi:hypothetical protein
MRKVNALIIKFIMVTIVLEIVLNLMTNLTFWNTVVVSAAVTIIAYSIGDLLILRATNNIIATIADVGLAFVVIYMFNLISYTVQIPFISALVSAAALGVGEWFFHKHFADSLFPGRTEQREIR